MKRRHIAGLLLTLPLLMASGIPNFFAGLIGDNVQDYCQMTAEEQNEMLNSVNRYTGTHKVVVVCGEVIAKAETPIKTSRKTRIAR